MFGRVIVLLIAIASGTVTSQVPEFAQQYRQRLGGAIDALAEVVADFRRDAEAENLTPESAIARLKLSDDAFARRRGVSMERASDRLESLIDQMKAMQNAGPIQRIAVFARHADGELMRRTAADFEPGVPVTGEGAISAGLGVLAGLIVSWMTMAGGRRVRKRIRRKRAGDHARDA
ncbi:DUF2937 family protein [Breoghania sp. L-A4]|uniref:DUF2937 family protein n=1 Tax=Breoghania sp. L-A4 TaxID=2304600 RepID=UPI000E35E5FA|nr:DUF2937 family protein [Breoghania sp. L-A4]AXS41903.1 DUF2937 family protein [Breoghania sp. L-A4]